MSDTIKIGVDELLILATYHGLIQGFCMALCCNPPAEDISRMAQLVTSTKHITGAMRYVTRHRNRYPAEALESALRDGGWCWECAEPATPESAGRFCDRHQLPHAGLGVPDVS